MGVVTIISGASPLPKQQSLRTSASSGTEASEELPGSESATSLQPVSNES